MSLWRFRVFIGLLLLMSACAAPIRVTSVSSQTAQRELTKNVLSAGEESPFSRIVLNRANLLDRFDDDPEDALRTLHAGFVSGLRGPYLLFALTELSFLHAERTKQRPYYLAAALYASAFLFPPAGEPAPDPFDPRFRDACDLYNRALTKALLVPDGDRADFAGGVWPLPFGVLEVDFDPAQLTWLDRKLEDAIPLADVEVKGLRNRYRRPGFGAPFAASAPGAAGQEGLQVVPKLKVPVTAVLRIENPRNQLATGRIQGRLELYVTTDVDSVQIGGQQVPLEAEPTAALAHMLGSGDAQGIGLWEFLFGDLLHERTQTQLLALEPYRPGRIPIVFVHGTVSSPVGWAQMFNELLNVPEIRQRYQFWFFIYETGNPILYSAMRLRESLETAVRTVDPGGQDAALRQMVLLGHSQGGLLVKLMAADIGDEMRAWVGPALERPTLSEETRDLFRRILAVRPLPFVRRVIFLATPHRGSYIAGNWIAHQVARLVRFPGQVLRATEDLLRGDPELTARLHGRTSSVAGMTPGSPLVKTLAPAPLAPWIAGHSIIAVSGEGPPQQDTDGVVAYESAHLEGMASEKIVKSGHSVQQSAEGIREVWRILIEHAAQP